ncbi:MAG TPA: ATP-dependent Clp protease proteolytic subunit [Streptosporangiaceae bacterium]|jgi:ATP-dependent Clp protease protease subunit|nr:ATP-dependent Clp protease proteolytic subunit [Streptosporangiaceae bacterium]
MNVAEGWENAAGWPGQLYQRLLERRIVMARGKLDDETATVLCAQLLTLDAEGEDPIRVEIQGLDAELQAALTVMGVLDVLRVPVHAYCAGRVSGPALGVLASCARRYAYPNAVLVLTEPALAFNGTTSQVASHEEQVRTMVDSLYFRLADVTGREVDEIRDDARAGRFLTVADAISYGLVEAQAEPR